MTHCNTERLTNYWRARRDGDQAPARASVDPIHLGPLLPQLFMLGREPDDRWSVRLAGALVADLHGRDPKGELFDHLFREEDRASVRLRLARLLRAPDAAVFTAEGRTETGRDLQLEVFVGPLANKAGHIDRMLGLYQPAQALARLRGAAIGPLSLTVSPASHLRLAAVDGRLIA